MGAWLYNCLKSQLVCLYIYKTHTTVFNVSEGFFTTNAIFMLVIWNELKQEKEITCTSKDQNSCKEWENVP